VRNQRLTELFGLDGRCAVVTDSGRGLSMEIAAVLADAGARVAVVNSEPALAESLAAEIRDRGGAAIALGCDLADEAAVADSYTRIAAELGRPDILVNCAALLLNLPFVDTTPGLLDEQYRTNLRAPYLWMREAVRRMLAAGGGGRIVNITTMGALQPVLTGNALYSSSRAALNMMCRNVAHDHLKDRILVNAILPGSFAGKVAMHPLSRARVQAGHPITGAATQPGRLALGDGNPLDVAAAVLFLVGPSGSFITGQTLTLDGGFLLT
jgi:meso-butanediol dehydrogenase / (S,S)-butanediol dehydrogenase / diacetyl reductase